MFKILVKNVFGIDMVDPTKTPEFIRKLRKVAGLTQQQAGELIGLNPNHAQATFSKREKGRESFDISDFFKILSYAQSAKSVDQSKVEALLLEFGVIRALPQKEQRYPQKVANHINLVKEFKDPSWAYRANELLKRIEDERPERKHAALKAIEDVSCGDGPYVETRREPTLPEEEPAFSKKNTA